MSDRGEEISGRVGDKTRIKVRKRKCTLEEIEHGKGDNDYVNTEKYGNKAV